MNEQMEKQVPYTRKYWRQKTLTNSGLNRYDEIKVDELLGVPRRLLNVFQFNYNYVFLVLKKERGAL